MMLRAKETEGKDDHEDMMRKRVLEKGVKKLEQKKHIWAKIGTVRNFYAFPIEAPWPFISLRSLWG